jgi:hypothetical protein
MRQTPHRSEAKPVMYKVAEVVTGRRVNYANVVNWRFCFIIMANNFLDHCIPIKLITIRGGNR